jgi:site-specific recombinase XerD
VSEVVCLKSEDIDAKRGLILIEASKGQKNRYTILSKAALNACVNIGNFTVLRASGYFRRAKKGTHLSTRSGEKVFDRPLKAAIVKKRLCIH